MPREPKMKTFGPPRTYSQIKALCKQQGLLLDDRLYRKQFIDSINVSGGGCTVVYNTFNGRFSGRTPDGKDFFSSSTKYENEAWFQGLLSFFYTPAAATKAPARKAVFK